MEALKAVVDKARHEWFSPEPSPESNWIMNSLEKQKDFFITTKKFLPFLDGHNFDYPGRAAQAVLVTLAVVATDWPPPEGVIKDISKMVRELPICERAARAPEMVIAYLLGWGRPDLNRSGARWESALAEARACLRAVMYVSTDSSLTWLHRYVIGFPEEDTSYWVSRVFHRFTAENPGLRCFCFLESAPPGTTVEDFPQLRGNAFRRAVTCLLEQHHLSLWVPHQLPLWLFAQRAVKGFIGKFRPVQFPTGMLYPRLRRGFMNQSRAPITLAKIARHYCNHCKSWTVNTTCQTPGCHQRKLDPQHSYVKASRFLIMEGEEGGFSPKSVWTCRGPKSKLSSEVNGPEEPLCKNIHIHSRCDRLICSEIHDRCPLHSCGAPHPTDKARRLSEVHFYNAHFAPEVEVDSEITEAASVKPETKRVTSVIDEAALAARKEFGNRHYWIQQIISCLEDDFKKWIGLVQTEGHVCWDRLWKALEGTPDRPATSARLRHDFENVGKLTLSKIFRLKFELAGRDWSLVERYRPVRGEENEKST